MKRTATSLLGILIAIVILFGFSLSRKDGRIHLKITKEENGEKSVFEKTYTDMNELQSDEALKNFDILVDDWAAGQGNMVFHSNGSAGDGEKRVMIRKKMGDSETFSWSADTEHDGEIETEIITDDDKHVIIKELEKDEDGNVKREKVIKIKTADGEQEFTMQIDGDSDTKGLWMDKDGNVTTFTDEDIEKMIQEHARENGEIHKRIKVITSDGEDGEEQVVIMKKDGDDSAEIKVDVEKEVDADGNERIVNKNVWITKDGKTIELKDEDAYQFESDGDKIKITVDGKTLDEADFSGGDMEGRHMLTLRDNDAGAGSQTMNINVEEKNGDKYIEIDIKRTSELNVTISDILKDDSQLDEVDFNLKNNLKPSDLSYYPNPSNGVFNLTFSLEKKGEVSVKVVDILGNEVYREKILDFDGRYDNKIDLSGKDKGIYVLQIIQGKKTLSRKILIE